MKVLHVIAGMRPEDGGTAYCVPQMAMAQKLAGLDVGIAYFAADELTREVQEAANAGVAMHPFRGSFSRLNRVMFSLDMLFRLERIAKGYDVLMVHLDWVFPVWWGAHVARKLGKPYIMMPHGNISPSAMKNGTWKKCLVGPLDRHAMKKATAVWTTSPMEREWSKKYVQDVKVDVMPIGLDTLHYVVSREKPCGKKILLFIGRISAIKGLDILAEAWRRVTREGARAWKLVIAGPDDRGYFAKMERLFGRMCPEGSYELCPAVYGKAKVELLRDASAFVLSSRSENWSVTISEAMASGLPVICTKGTPWTCIPELGAGWRTEISADGLADAILEMMGRSDEELHEMGLRGRKWVQEHLDWSQVGAAMKGKLEALLK